MHWHGLRLENRYDGTHETQAPIPVGGSFSYRISFPDPGVYWYHPHIREDYGQELGPVRQHPRRPGRARLLAAGAPRAAPDPRRRPDRGRQDRAVQPRRRRRTPRWAASATSCSSAARPTPSFAAQQGEVVRLYLTNTANTRVFNVALPGARMKLVGGDSGRVEREELVESVVLAPSERVVVDVLFEQPGRADARAPHARAHLHARDDRRRRRAGDAAARGRVRGPAREPGVGGRAASGSRRTSTRRPTRRSRSSPRWTWARPRAPSSTSARCTPRSSGEASDRCPKCGMKLLAVAAPASYVCPMHPEVVSEHARPLPEVRHEAGRRGARHGVESRARATHGTTQHEHHGARARRAPARRTATRHDHAHDAGGIEWEDDMVEVNRLTTPANMRWKLVDRDTGAANHAIDWQFTVGDQVKLRLVNEMDSDHPMHHPFHVHGAGRFVVLARDGVPSQPRLEGHRPRPHRRDGRHPARRHQPRPLDGALPHRRAPRERDDVQLRRHARRRVLVLKPAGFIYLLGCAL